MMRRDAHHAASSRQLRIDAVFRKLLRSHLQLVRVMLGNVRLLRQLCRDWVFSGFAVDNVVTGSGASPFLPEQGFS